MASANEKNEMFPEDHTDFIKECNLVKQNQPTLLLLRYGQDDYNCLHQDLYGSKIFPLQVTILLSEPNQDYIGGEFVLTEQRPRRQSRVEVVRMNKGDAVVFAVNHRPQPGKNGYYKVNMRHRVSAIHTGTRHVLGLIFHDAK